MEKCPSEIYWNNHRSAIWTDYEKLAAAGITKELKVLKYESDDYPGYSYIKIYNRNATKENMIQYLKKMTGLSQIITFGTIPGRYDVLVSPGDTNRVVHMLKKLYEPVRRIL